MIFAVHLAHLFVVFLWLSRMHIHGAYLSNYEAWLTNPLTTYPSAQLVWPIVGQDALNADTSSSTGQSVTVSGYLHYLRLLSSVAFRRHNVTRSAQVHRLDRITRCTSLFVATPMYSFRDSNYGSSSVCGYCVYPCRSHCIRLNVSTYPIVNVTRSWNAQHSQTQTELLPLPTTSTLFRSTLIEVEPKPCDVPLCAITVGSQRRLSVRWSRSSFGYL